MQMVRCILVVLVTALVFSAAGCVSPHEKPEKVLKPKPPYPKPSQPEKAEKYKVSGIWTQLKGLDGGDMHVIRSVNGILFVSHGFSGVWRSEDGGKSWEIVNQNDFVDVHFYDVKEYEGWIYAASNKGIWKSGDGGKTWEKVYTGYSEIDNGKYLVVSLAVYQNRLFFTAILDKSYRKETAGTGMLFYLENGRAVKFESPANDEILVEAKDPTFSCQVAALAFMFTNGKWEKMTGTRGGVSTTYGDGVFYTTLDEVKKGYVTLTAVNGGLLTLKIRNLAYNGQCLFAGTQGFQYVRFSFS